MNLKIIIPSKNKASSIVANNLVSDAILCVPNCQIADYSQYNRSTEIIGYPDDIITYSTRQNWILKQFNHVFFISDNVVNFLRLCGNPKESTKVEPKKVTELIHNLDDIAAQMGAYLFGFNTQPATASYHGLKPFRCSGNVDGSAFGIRPGSKLFWDDNISEDLNQVWLSGLNASCHRFMFVDERFAFKKAQTYERLESDGKTADANYRLLRKCFGSTVRQKKNKLEIGVPF